MIHRYLHGTGSEKGKGKEGQGINNGRNLDLFYLLGIRLAGKVIWDLNGNRGSIS